jgi:hypothetical protein
MYKENIQIQIYQDRIKSLTDQINTFDNLYLSKDYLMKMFNLNKNDIRKSKINRIFNDKAREI